MEVTILRPQYGYMREVVNMHVLANRLTQKCLHFYPTKTPLESFFDSGDWHSMIQFYLQI